MHRVASTTSLYENHSGNHYSCTRLNFLFLIGNLTRWVVPLGFGLASKNWWSPVSIEIILVDNWWSLKRGLHVGEFEISDLVRSIFILSFNWILFPENGFKSHAIQSYCYHWIITCDMAASSCITHSLCSKSVKLPQATKLIYVLWKR